MTDAAIQNFELDILRPGSAPLSCFTKTSTPAATPAEAKGLLRRVIRYHLGAKPLNTRRILQDLKQL